MKKLIFLFSMLLIGIDQVVKYFVVSNLEQYKSIKLIPNFFYMTFVKNEGAAFSILDGGRWIFVIIGLLALILIIRYIFLDKKIKRYDVVSYSLVIGGIAGNLIDRIVQGSVVDYLDFYILGYNAPVFNFADMCIVIGTFMIMYILVIKGDSNENNHS
jgi:signal peptidase II